jgi:NAD(P)H dehydrogenase (quinone)
MRKILGIVLSFFVMSLLPRSLPAQQLPSVLIVYYSQQGHTREMAEAVARGARAVKGVSVKLLKVNEATNEDMLSADAIIVGSPVVNANVAPEVVSFIDRWPFVGSPLRDKIGAAFVTGGGISAGEELTQLNILHSMMIFGLSPFDRPTAKTIIGEQFLRKGEALGRRVAEVTVRWNRNR